MEKKIKCTGHVVQRDPDLIQGKRGVKVGFEADAVEQEGGHYFLMGGRFFEDCAPDALEFWKKGVRYDIEITIKKKA